MPATDWWHDAAAILYKLLFIVLGLTLVVLLWISYFGLPDVGIGTLSIRPSLAHAAGYPPGDPNSGPNDGPTPTFTPTFTPTPTRTPTVTPTVVH